MIVKWQEILRKRKEDMHHFHKSLDVNVNYISNNDRNVCVCVYELEWV